MKKEWPGFREKKLPYCNGKQSYDKKGAMSAKNKRFKDDHAELRVYQCNLCPYWHLTHQNPYRKEYLRNKKHNT